MDAAPLPDGTYDAIVVDVSEVDGSEPPQVALELAVLAGPHKGQVIEVRGPSGGNDPFDLFGIPATITVVDGTPRVRLEP